MQKDKDSKQTSKSSYEWVKQQQKTDRKAIDKIEKLTKYSPQLKGSSPTFLEDYVSCLNSVSVTLKNSLIIISSLFVFIQVCFVVMFLKKLRDKKAKFD